MKLYCVWVESWADHSDIVELVGIYTQSHVAKAIMDGINSSLGLPYVASIEEWTADSEPVYPDDPMPSESDQVTD